MGRAERGREDGSDEGGVFYGGEYTKIGQGAENEERDDGFDWTVNGATCEGHKRDAHGGESLKVEVSVCVGYEEDGDVYLCGSGRGSS